MRSRSKSRFRADGKTWFSALVAGLGLGFGSVAFGGQDAELDINISAATLTSDAEELGATTERGTLEDIFSLQKELVYEILWQVGLDPDKLSPVIKAAIDQPQTTNLDAFLAFSQGLDWLDQGRYVEAHAGFQRAAELDPQFAIAVQFRDTAPLLQEQAADVAEASIKQTPQTNLTPVPAGSSSGDSEEPGAGLENGPKAAPKDSPKGSAGGGKDAAAAGPNNVLGDGSEAAPKDSSGGEGPAVASPKEAAADGVTTEPLAESPLPEPLAESLLPEPLTEAPPPEPLTEAPPPEPLTEAPPPEPLTEAPPPEPLTEAPPPEPLTEAPPREPLTEAPPPEPLTEAPPPEPLAEAPPPEPLTESPPPKPLP